MKCSSYSLDFISDKYRSFFDSRFVEGDYYVKGVYSYYTTFLSRRLKFDIHPAVEIMGVVSGECVIPMADKEISLKSGQAIFIDSNQQHGLFVKNNCKMYCIQFMFVQEPGLIKFGDMVKNDKVLHQFLKQKKDYFVFADFEDIASTIKRINRVERLNDAGGYHDLLVAEVIFKIANSVNGQSECLSIASYNVQKAMEFMANNIQKGITVKETADYLGLDQSYFGRLFKKHTGILPIDYLNTCRVNKAKILLEDEDVPISEICRHVGVSTRQYFTYLFSKYEGITPSQYRKSRLKQMGKTP